jgi:hypothetical protein
MSMRRTKPKYNGTRLRDAPTKPGINVKASECVRLDPRTSKPIEIITKNNARLQAGKRAVEGIEDRGSSGLTTGQLLKP